MHSVGKIRSLVDELKLQSETYNAKLLRGVPDKDNPLFPINRKCFFLKKFLNSHSVFEREELQNYLNLFAFIMNEGNQYEKVEKILEWSLHCPKPSITGINSANKVLKQ